MSLLTSIIPFGIGCIGSWTYTNYQLQQEKQQNHRNQQKILEVEEEIVRLKREMQICGIISSKDNN